ncbi:alpha/beta fold hydrolase [Arthrobacter polaris]|uniref:alpha/beta fold hydrolase n=1 Tax=Arthrobacter polaris TaxID=2813727 RepID=UPI001F15CF3A|nr:alpha/beta hydrolase [Arthrobacter polaris]UIK89230.1 alpha/beta hydrolase [Arthrobacter polaris]
MTFDESFLSNKTRRIAYGNPGIYIVVLNLLFGAFTPMIGLDRVKVGPPAWLDLPAHYLLTTQDRCVPPVLQRDMAQRMGAVVSEIESSHAPVLSHPRAVAEFLDEACGAISVRRSL